MSPAGLRSIRCVSTVESLAREMGFEYSIDVLPITVAALMTPEWIARRIKLPAGATRVLVPGYCTGDLQPIQAATGVPVERGPRDLRELPRFFGREPMPADYGAYDIEIIAEINHCPRLALAEILAQAQQLAADGADVIDVGCEPDGPWTGVGDVVRALRDDGHRVSIDSLDPREIEPAVKAGAELVLSVNSSNREAARDWGCEVVVVPTIRDRSPVSTKRSNTWPRTACRCGSIPCWNRSGLASPKVWADILQVRERYPDAEMMMGIGNLTELTDADSAAINVVLLGFCEELGIRSVLTTQVINWARSSVRECDLARRLVYHSIRHRVLPKHLEPRLVMLRDPAVIESTDGDLERLAREIKDANYRVFVAGGEVHVVSHELHLHGDGSVCRIRAIATEWPRRRAAEEPGRGAFVLSGLRNVQGGDGARARQAVSAGRVARLGIFDARGIAALFASTAESIGGGVTHLC